MVRFQDITSSKAGKNDMWRTAWIYSGTITFPYICERYTQMLFLQMVQIYFTQIYFTRLAAGQQTFVKHKENTNHYL